ncbi:hypothetical protein SETIT_9G175500v2 [Setaria italica]|uniref:Uncharacterized protein n=1 Tax=Setaria italica TaxID=4555 RepID=A0A368SHW5_SETIT|nr:hypothetical protein SETIT_9G175500v2 [Setaria italica]
MDHLLQLHVEHHHHGSSLKRCDLGGGDARFGKGADDNASRAVLALAAMASPALLFLSSYFSMVTTRTALFALSNAIFLLLAADCRRWFFSAAAGDVADACFEPAGDVLVKQQGRQQHLEAAAQQRAVQLIELLRRLDNGGDATVGLETIVFEEPTCETGEGLDESLEIDELNKRFDEFIRSRRNK